MSAAKTTQQTWLITGVNSGFGRHARGDRVAGTIRNMDAMAGQRRLLLCSRGPVRAPRGTRGTEGSCLFLRLPLGRLRSGHVMAGSSSRPSSSPGRLRWTAQAADRATGTTGRARLSTGRAAR